MNHATNPSQIVLDGHHSYVYRITNVLTGYTYIGKHKHTKGERWRDYLGSAFRLQDEQNYLGRQFFVKELVEWAPSEARALIREAAHIRSLVNSGKPHYNVSNFDGALFATDSDQIRFMQAFRLAHESWSHLRDERARLRQIIRVSASERELFAMQLDMVDAAMSHRSRLVQLKRQIDAGSIKPPRHSRRHSRFAVTAHAPRY